MFSFLHKKREYKNIHDAGFCFKDLPKDYQYMLTEEIGMSKDHQKDVQIIKTLLMSCKSYLKKKDVGKWEQVMDAKYSLVEKEKKKEKENGNGGSGGKDGKDGGGSGGIRDMFSKGNRKGNVSPRGGQKKNNKSDKEKDRIEKERNKIKMEKEKIKMEKKKLKLIKKVRGKYQKIKEKEQNKNLERFKKEEKKEEKNLEKQLEEHVQDVYKPNGYDYNNNNKLTAKSRKSIFSFSTEVGDKFRKGFQELLAEKDLSNGSSGDNSRTVENDDIPKKLEKDEKKILDSKSSGSGNKKDKIDMVLEKEQRKTFANLKIREELFEIDFKDVNVKKSIGKGGSNSVVFLAEYAGKEVAFKCFKLSDILDGDEKFSEFEKEVEILASISHPHILQFYGATLKIPRIGIVMEYCDKGDLKQFLKNYSKFSIRGRIKFLVQIASGMIYLHKRNILHRDLKPQNVLITRQLECKIIDFGLSKIVKRDSDTKTQRVGTSYYMAPEITLGQKYSKPIDVFSFGILAFEVIFFFKPFGKKDLMAVELKIAQDSTFRPKPKHKIKDPLQKYLFTLMEQCWYSDPKMRLTFSEIHEKLLQKMKEK